MFKSNALRIHFHFKSALQKNRMNHNQIMNPPEVFVINIGCFCIAE